LRFFKNSYIKLVKRNKVKGESNKNTKFPQSFTFSPLTFTLIFMDFFIFLHESFNKPVLVYLNSLTDIKFIANIVYIFADLPIFLIPLFLV
jgi:hypothetical protein